MHKSRLNSFPSTFAVLCKTFGSTLKHVLGQFVDLMTMESDVPFRIQTVSMLIIKVAVGCFDCHSLLRTIYEYSFIW